MDYSRAIGSPERRKGLLTHLLAYFLTYTAAWNGWKKVGPLLKMFRFSIRVSRPYDIRHAVGREERVSTPLLFLI